MKKYITYILILLIAFSFYSCRKLVDVGPPKGQLTPEKAFTDDQSAIAVISNTYAQFNTLVFGNITPYLGIYTDELLTTSSNSGTLEFYNGVISTTNSINLNIWKGFYSVIYQCNALLENLPNSPDVTSNTKNQLLNEALFLRALSYFYLINLYGNVPLILTTSVEVTSVAPRNSVSEIYSKILSDLKSVEANLPATYPSSERVRANKWTAVALLSRIYLFQQDWNNAETKASEVISSGLYNPLDNSNTCFLKGGKETIFQFWSQNGFTIDGSLLIPSAGSTPTYPITPNLLAAFLPADLRKSNWLNSATISGQTYYYPYKYRNRVTVTGSNAEYLIALKLSELYLIRAEARAKQNNISGSQADLNIILSRAGLPNTTANSQATLLLAINNERRVELFCEMGYRFFDLKRTNQLNTVNLTIKPLWKPSGELLPIPQYEILNNPNLIQNPGY